MCFYRVDSFHVFWDVHVCVLSLELFVDVLLHMHVFFVRIVFLLRC